MVTLIGKRLVIASRVGGLILSGLVCAAPGSAQSALAQHSTQQSSTTSTAKPAARKSAGTKSTTAKPATAAKKTPAKPLVYIDDERSVKAADASTPKTVSSRKTTQASTNPKQSADLTKAFQQNCPSVGLTDSKAKASYDVTFQREPGAKGVKTAFGLTNAVHKTSKIEVMSKSGKELFSETGHSTNQLVKDACTAIGTPGLKVAAKN